MGERAAGCGVRAITTHFVNRKLALPAAHTLLQLRRLFARSDFLDKEFAFFCTVCPGAERPGPVGPARVSSGDAFFLAVCPILALLAVFKSFTFFAVSDRGMGPRLERG
jgi:hypothetical protein